MVASKPVFPWQLPLLGGIAVFGLIAQLVAGEAAFSLLERDAPYSWFVSFFLEAAAIIAALEIALSYKEIQTISGDWRNEGTVETKHEVNWPAVIVEGVTLSCSAIFNYTWVSKVLTDASEIQIAAYSIGPLAALSGIGMTTGNVLRKWLAAMDEWKQATASQAQAKEDDAVAHRRALAVQSHQAKLALQAENAKAAAVERTRSAKAGEALERKRIKQQAEVSTVGEPRAELVTGTVPFSTGTTVQDRAAAVLKDRPGVTGTELARILNVSDGYGRRLKRDSGNGKH